MGDIENQVIFEKVSKEVRDATRSTIENSSIYWNIYEPLSYNCLFNFIVGNRGGGKTYGAKEYTLKDYFKNKKQFIYVRRTATELNSSVKYLLEDIIDKYPGKVWQYKGGEIMMGDWNEEKGKPKGNWETVGFAINLSTAANRKSISYPKVGTIIFDEFILTPTGRNGYLPDEVKIFLDLYETIARMRDVKVFFLSNAITVYNPYFIYFNLKIPTNKRMISRERDDILIQMVMNDRYISEKKKTRFGKIIENTEYENYAILNNFLLDDNTMIKKKTGRLNYVCTIENKESFYGFYMDYANQVFYLSRDKDINQKMVIRTVLKDGRLNPLVMKNRSRLPELKMLVYGFVEGTLYFEDQLMKHEAMEMIGRLM